MVPRAHRPGSHAPPEPPIRRASQSPIEQLLAILPLSPDDRCSGAQPVSLWRYSVFIVISFFVLPPLLIAYTPLALFRNTPSEPWLDRPRKRQVFVPRTLYTRKKEGDPEPNHFHRPTRAPTPSHLRNAITINILPVFFSKVPSVQGMTRSPSPRSGIPSERPPSRRVGCSERNSRRQ